MIFKKASHDPFNVQYKYYMFIFCFLKMYWQHIFPIFSVDSKRRAKGRNKPKPAARGKKAKPADSVEESEEEEEAPRKRRGRKKKEESEEESEEEQRGRRKKAAGSKKRAVAKDASEEESEEEKGNKKEEGKKEQIRRRKRRTIRRRRRGMAKQQEKEGKINRMIKRTKAKTAGAVFSSLHLHAVHTQTQHSSLPHSHTHLLP